MMDMAIKMKKAFKEIFIKQLNEVKIVNEMMNDKWIGIEEAAEYLGIKPITVRDWIKKDTGIPAHKIGKKWKF